MNNELKERAIWGYVQAKVNECEGMRWFPYDESYVRTQQIELQFLLNRIVHVFKKYNIVFQKDHKIPFIEYESIRNKRWRIYQIVIDFLGKLNFSKKICIPTLKLGNGDLFPGFGGYSHSFRLVPRPDSDPKNLLKDYSYDAEFLQELINI